MGKNNKFKENDKWGKIDRLTNEDRWMTKEKNRRIKRGEIR